VRSHSDRRIFQLAQYLNPTKGGPIYRSALCVSSPALDLAADCCPPARFIPLHFFSDCSVGLQPGPLRSRHHSKLVFSNSHADPLAWKNTRLVKRPIADEIKALKQQRGDPLRSIGSISLVKSMMQ
jgi:hypothetical protein